LSIHWLTKCVEYVIGFQPLYCGRVTRFKMHKQVTAIWQDGKLLKTYACMKTYSFAF